MSTCHSPVYASNFNLWKGTDKMGHFVSLQNQANTAQDFNQIKGKQNGGI